MDQELKAYLDEKFGEMSNRLGQMDSRFDGVDARFDGVNSRLDGVEARLDGVEARLDGMDSRFESMDSRFDRVEEGIRHNGVEIEGMRGEIKLLAEGIFSFDQRLTSLQNQVTRELADHRQMVTSAFGVSNDRLQALEGWRETKERDPLELIKERFGLGSKPSLTDQ
ncbi:MAG: hypothetical protein ACJ75H_05625 [Thermoanaerobaculia bacterium]